jgi:prepilin peptidase CpaA
VEHHHRKFKLALKNIKQKQVEGLKVLYLHLRGTMMQLIISTAVLTLLFFIVFILDFKYQIIPNWLTVGTIVVSWILALIVGGFSLLLTSLLGTFVGFLILFIPYALGGVGGGDIKFLAAVGSLTSLSLLVKIVLLGLIIGGAASIVVILKNTKITSFKQFLYALFLRKYLPNNVGKSHAIPLGSCISLAGLLLIGFQILG